VLQYVVYSTPDDRSKGSVTFAIERRRKQRWRHCRGRPTLRINLCSAPATARGRSFVVFSDFARTVVFRLSIGTKATKERIVWPLTVACKRTRHTLLSVVMVIVVDDRGFDYSIRFKKTW